MPCVPSVVVSRESPGRAPRGTTPRHAGSPPAAETVKHIDRCLPCLSCESTCLAEVDYRRLVDQTRVHIESTFRRPWKDRTDDVRLGHRIGSRLDSLLQLFIAFDELLVNLLDHTQ